MLFAKPSSQWHLECTSCLYFYSNCKTGDLFFLGNFCEYALGSYVVLVPLKADMTSCVLHTVIKG